MLKKFIPTALILMMIFTTAGLTVLAQEDTPPGSLPTALALRQIAPDDVTGQRGTVLSLEPDTAGELSAIPVTGQADAVHLMGWPDADTLLYLQRDDDTAYVLVAYMPEGLAIVNTVIGSHLPVDHAYALTPDGTRLLSWPSASAGAADFASVTVYDVATMDVLAEINTAETNVKGTRLAGLTDELAYFITSTPGDGLIIVDLLTNSAGPVIDLLATGDDAETVISASLLPGQLLAVVGRIDPKGLAGIYTIPLDDSGQPLVDTTAGPRPLAQAVPEALPDLVEAQRVFFSHDGTQTAIVAAVPGDFSGSQLFVTSIEAADPQPLTAALAYNSCVAFTPDDEALLFTDPTRSEVLAISPEDTAPVTVWSGQPDADLCEAVWQPAPAETTTGPTTPDPTAELSIGMAVTGQITAEQSSVDYPVDLTAEQTITFTMQRVDGDLDALLVLLDPAGRELTRNDDAPVQVGDTDMNAQITDFTVPETGRYTIRATRFFEADGTSTGAFRLSLADGTTVIEGPTNGDTTLTLGETIKGMINDDSYAVSYTIDLAAGETVTINMEATSGDLDPFLNLLGPNGDVLQVNDDALIPIGDSVYNAQIERFTALEAGSYVIQATRYDEADGNSSGEYNLTVLPADDGSLIAASPPPIDGDYDILPGDVLAGVITDDQPVIEYRLPLDAGQAVTISLEAFESDLDAFLILLGPGLDEMARNDDATIQTGDNPLNAQIQGFIAPTAGIYTIQATRFGEAAGTTAGEFRLFVTEPTASTTPNPEPGSTLAVGATIMGNITDTAYSIPYQVSLAAGEVITISMERQSGDLDAYLFLIGPDGSEAASNDDAEQTIGGSTYNAQILNFSVPQTGTYTIEATRYGQGEGDSIGQFQLSITGPPTHAADGTVVQIGDSLDGLFTEAPGSDSYTLHLEAGQMVTITMEATSGDLDAQLILQNSAGEEVVRNDDALTPVANNTLNAQIVDFVATETDTYTIIATRYGEDVGSSTGSYQLRITGGADLTNGNLITGTELTVGAEAMGSISEDQATVDYSLPLETGQTVTITMQQVNGNLDSYLTLIGPDGEEIASNDDADEEIGGNPLNAQLAGFSAPTTGTYTIRATRFGEADGSTNGQFRLSITAGEAGPIGVGTANNTPLMVGGSVEGQITDVQPSMSYPVTLENNQQITITMERTGGTLDAYLTLLDDTGSPVATNDDAGTPVGDSELNAQIAGFIVPSSGTYTIQASRFGESSGSTTGSYRLTVSSGSTASSSNTGELEIYDGALFAAPITVGSVLRDTISTTPYYQVQYPLSLNTGDTIGLTVEATSGDLDTTLSIFDSFDNLVAFNDDAAIQVGDSMYNSQIISYTAPLTGEYMIMVSRYDGEDGDTSGSYTLQVMESVPVEAISGGVLTVGAAQENSLSATVYAVDYIIMLDAGQMITVTMEALENALDPTLIIYDPQNNEVAYNDDADDQDAVANPLDAQIAGFVAPQAGQYIIRATRFFEEGGSSIGRFQVNVTEGAGPGSGGSSK